MCLSPRVTNSRSAEGVEAARLFRSLKRLRILQTIRISDRLAIAEEKTRKQAIQIRTEYEISKADQTKNIAQYAGVSVL
jgi:hypothetical protein